MGTIGAYMASQVSLMEQDIADLRLTKAAKDVLAERKRQIDTEGWTPEHDDEHGGGQLAQAAACYAWAAATSTVRDREEGKLTVKRTPTGGHTRLFQMWPWSWDWWKPKTARQDLVRAGALILAEIERLDRLTPKA